MLLNQILVESEALASIAGAGWERRQRSMNTWIQLRPHSQNILLPRLSAPETPEATTSTPGELLLIKQPFPANNIFALYGIDFPNRRGGGWVRFRALPGELRFAGSAAKIVRTIQEEMLCGETASVAGR